MKMSIQEEQIVKVLEHFGFTEINKHLWWSITQPEHLLEDERRRQLFVKVEYWSGRFTLATVGTHMNLEEAIKMQQQLEFALKVLTMLVEVAPDMVHMKHPTA